ncbi:anti-sigma factor family protein [Thermogemmatispora sp.]|uniref:anti-sigma factor family protein n=1 Tax=Thermogemmatispora sp. TaxID=1968838 RepID=UPI001D28CA57|nr:zf-HC2 domain-containing protein [Thermogemmatispora sp.]MBX5450686.1 zf-HC2 domain-containing protein [Thermogemmatispora sp.]
MNCEELSQLLPDLVEGTLPPALQAEAEAALPLCPECQRELELARQVRTLLSTLQAEYVGLHLPADFERRLLARIHAEQSSLELLDLSSQTLLQWLIDLINLIGALLDPATGTLRLQTQPSA